MDQVYRRRDELVTRQIAGEAVIVPIRGHLADMERIFMVSPVAEYIWRQLDGQASLREIGEGIVAAFDVEPAQADADLREFIAELLAADLIVGVS